MKGYEILFIIKAHLADDQYKEKEENFKKYVTSKGGEIIEFDAIGLKELPLTFKDHTQGYFMRCQFKGNNDVLDEIKKRFAVDESIIRHLNVTLDSILTPEQLTEKLG